MKITNKQLIEYVKEKAEEVFNLSHGVCKEPLDGDMTELLSQVFYIELDYLNGNITEEEYGDEMDNITKEI